MNGYDANKCSLIEMMNYYCTLQDLKAKEAKFACFMLMGTVGSFFSKEQGDFFKWLKT
jgi:hypothetical protein